MALREARQRKGLADFPCTPFGQVAFEAFAWPVLARVVTTCIACPPDSGSGGHGRREIKLT